MNFNMSSAGMVSMMAGAVVVLVLVIVALMFGIAALWKHLRKGRPPKP